MRKFLVLFAILLSLPAMAREDIEVVNIENAAVQAYMADSTYYYNNDYKTSVITKYNTDRYGKRLYWPQGKKVTWTPTVSADSIREIRVTVSEHSNFHQPITFNTFSKSDSSYVIRNNLPNRQYYYKVEEFLVNGEVNRVAQGVYRTVGQVRMIQVDNCSNVRDLGGWPTQYGVRVKYGLLFRSANLDRITSKGLHDFVDNLNVRAELDLRSESKLNYSKLGKDKDFLLLHHGAYISGLQKRSQVYVTDLRWIIARLKEGKSVDWHCAIGCDRCGTVSFLIEGLLGMSEIDICRDYELSTLSLGKKNKRTRSSLKSMFNYIRGFGPGNDLAQCFYNYWLSLGMREGELNYFLEKMLGESIFVVDSAQ